MSDGRFYVMHDARCLPNFHPLIYINYGNICLIQGTYLKDGTKKTPAVTRRSLWIVSSRCLDRLCELYIDSVQAFFALLCVESNIVTFANIVNQTADVDENLLAWVCVDYETETFGFVEELDSSRMHTKKIKKWKKVVPKNTSKVI